MAGTRKGAAPTVVDAPSQDEIDKLLGNISDAMGQNKVVLKTSEFKLHQVSFLRELALRKVSVDSARHVSSSRNKHKGSLADLFASPDSQVEDQLAEVNPGSPVATKKL